MRPKFIVQFGTNIIIIIIIIIWIQVFVNGQALIVWLFFLWHGKTG